MVADIYMKRIRKIDFGNDCNFHAMTFDTT